MKNDDDVDYILERINFPGTVVLNKDQELYSCGRGRNNKIVCLSLTVSRSHCMFIRTKEGLNVIDLASSNGVYVNGLPLSPNILVNLCENDIVGVGCPDINSTDSSMFIYKLCIAKSKPSESLLSEQSTNVASKCVTQNNNKLPDEPKTNEKSKSTTKQHFHDKRKLSANDSTPHLPPKMTKLQEASTVVCSVGEQSDNTPQNKVSNVNVRQLLSETEEDDVQILVDYSNTFANKESHMNGTNYVNSELTLLEKEDKLDNSSARSSNIVNTNMQEKHNVLPFPIYRSGCSKRVHASEQKSQPIVQFHSDNTNCPIKYNLQNRVSKTVTAFQSNNFPNKDQSSEKPKQTVVNNVHLNNSNIETILDRTRNSYQLNKVSPFDIQNTSVGNDNDCETLTASNLGQQTKNPHETSRDIEVDLQTDNFKELTCSTPMSLEPKSTSSPNKFKQIKQEPTNFSINDIINLSEDENNIFPCSQLFNAISDSEQKIKEETKEQTYEEHDNDDLFRAPDEAEVILLSDSEDEDNPWLEKLSKSQTINDTELIVKTEKEQNVFIDLVEEDEDIFDYPSVVGTSKIITKAIDDHTEENKDVKDKEKLEPKKDITRTIQEEPTDKIMYEPEGTNVIERNEQHKHINKSSSCTLNRTLENNSDLKIRNKSFSTVNMNVNVVLSDIMRNTASTTNNLKENIAEKRGKSSLKPSSSKRIPQIIEPPFLPRGEKRRTGYTIEKSNNQKTTMSAIEPNVLESGATSKPKSELQLTGKRKKKLPQKSKIDQNVNIKEQKTCTKYNSTEYPPSTDKAKSRSLSKEEKLEIINNRREKLKKIATEHKPTVENASVTKRGTAKAKAKVTLKTRNDFLLHDQNLSKECRSTDQINPANMPARASARVSNMIKLKDNSKSATNNVTVEAQCSTSKKQMHVTQDSTARASMSKAVESIAQNLQKSLSFLKATEISHSTVNNSNVLEARKVQGAIKLDRTRKIATTVTRNNVPIVNSSIATSSVGSSLRTKDRQQSQQNKKKVHFNDNLVIIHTYQIDSNCKLEKVVGKDAPIPKDKLSKTNKLVPYPKLEELLLYIFAWNPMWLEEQLHLKIDPPVVGDILLPMRLCYQSYEEYYKTVLPLLLLELWYYITKDFEVIDKNPKRSTVMCSVVNNSMTLSTIPSTNLLVTNMTLAILVTKEDVKRQAYPSYGDLVFLELATIENKKQTFCQVFAYVMSVQHTVLTPHSIFYNKELTQYVKQPHTLVTYTVITKPLQLNIEVNRPLRLRSVSYLRSNMRMIQALRYLPLSPLVNSILSPKTKDYQLPDVPDLRNCQLVTKDKLNERQLEAVLKITKSIVQKEAKVCLIQGPPGTGKSKVILNIITQVLYGDNRYKNSKASLRVLVCAPSNAAIDEIVLRLLEIRKTMEKYYRFKMVRVGRSETMHPTVRNISLSEIAKREVKRAAANCVSNDVNLEEDKRILEARITALKYELANSQDKGDSIAYNSIKMKLEEIIAKYALLNNRKKPGEINSIEFTKQVRATENKVLQGADIIACTLSSCYTNQMEYIFGGKMQRISVCIVDEATQSYEAETLIPLMLGVNTLVLVGDPNQLPATVLSQRAKKLGLDQSLFSRIQGIFEVQLNNPIIMLNIQYRMPNAIVHWPNKYFYGGKLKTVIQNHFELPFHSYRVFNIDSHQNSDKFSNTKEAEFVANVIISMINYLKLNTLRKIITIGVITPYNHQKLLLQSTINARISSEVDIIKNIASIEVNTIDNFQGQERDVIIMSCVRSQGIGFLSDRQRLCVALTRAKHSLILCGNFTTFQNDQMWNDLLSDARSHRVYINTGFNVKSNKLIKCIVK